MAQWLLQSVAARLFLGSNPGLRLFTWILTLQNLHFEGSKNKKIL